MREEELLSLFQLADASWPAGGFAFSSGLEAMAKLGQIHSMGSFSDYLRSYLVQVSEADLAFINSAFNSSVEMPAELYEILTDWDAFHQFVAIRRVYMFAV